MTPRVELAHTGNSAAEDSRADKLGSYYLANAWARSDTTGPAVIDLGKLSIRPATLEDPEGQLALIEIDGTPIDHTDEAAAGTALPAGYNSWREYALRSVHHRE